MSDRPSGPSSGQPSTPSSPNTSNPPHSATTPHSTAQQGSTSSLDAASEAGRDLKDAATAKLYETRDAAIHEAESRATAAKDGAADEISSIGDALRRASGDLRDGSPQERTFAGIADALAEVSDGIRGKDLSDMVGDVGHFARRNPLAFLGGAALLGFAAVRMARATQRGSGYSGASSQPYGARSTAPYGQPSTRSYGSASTGSHPTTAYGSPGASGTPGSAARPGSPTHRPGATPGSASTGSQAGSAPSHDTSGRTKS